MIDFCVDFSRAVKYPLKAGNSIEMAKILLAFLDCPHLYNKQLGFHNKECENVHDFMEIVPPDYTPLYHDSTSLSVDKVISLLKDGGGDFIGSAVFGEGMWRIDITPGIKSDYKTRDDGSVYLTVFDPHADMSDVDSIIRYLGGIGQQRM